jgi:hypothetical protein
MSTTREDKGTVPRPNVYAHHPPSVEQIGCIQAVRQAFEILAREVDGNTKPGSVSGRYVALCKTALEEACQWAVKSIVFEDYNDARRFPAIPDLLARIEALEAALAEKQAG